jgi:hypothetical protein
MKGGLCWSGAGFHKNLIIALYMLYYTVCIYVCMYVCMHVPV